MCLLAPKDGHWLVVLHALELESYTRRRHVDIQVWGSEPFWRSVMLRVWEDGPHEVEEHHLGNLALSDSRETVLFS
jgi:hypothetical protein